MNRSKKLIVLLAVLIVACVVTIAVMQHEEHKERIRNSDEIILELPGDSIQSLSWEYQSNTLSLHKGETWLYDDDEAFPVDGKKVSKMLEQFQSFGVSFVIEDVEDYGQYGLSDPTCTIRLATADASYEIKLGGYSTMDSQRYVSIGDGNVYLVKNDPLDQFDATLSDLIAHDETPWFSDVKTIQFQGLENYRIVYEEDSTSTYCAEDVYFTQRSGQSVPLDTNRVKGYLRTISNLSPTDYVRYNVSDEELHAYGLDEPELTVTVDYVTEEDESAAFTMHIGRDPKEQAESNDDSEEKEATAYVRIGASRIVYQITSDNFKKLTNASYDSLRHLEVLTADFDNDVYKIDISLEGKDYTITSETDNDEKTYSYAGEELDITALRKALYALSAESFTQEQPTEKEEISLTVFLDNENHPEVQIVLYRYDGSYCLAVVDGAPVSLVKRSTVVDLIEAVHAIVL